MHFGWGVHGTLFSRVSSATAQVWSMSSIPNTERNPNSLPKQSRNCASPFAGLGFVKWKKICTFPSACCCPSSTHDRCEKSWMHRCTNPSRIWGFPACSLFCGILPLTTWQTPSLFLTMPDSTKRKKSTPKKQSAKKGEVGFGLANHIQSKILCDIKSGEAWRSSNLPNSSARARGSAEKISRTEHSSVKCKTLSVSFTWQLKQVCGLIFLLLTPVTDISDKLKAKKQTYLNAQTCHFGKIDKLATFHWKQNWGDQSLVHAS